MLLQENIFTDSKRVKVLQWTTKKKKMLTGKTRLIFLQENKVFIMTFTNIFPLTRIKLYPELHLYRQLQSYDPYY